MSKRQKLFDKELIEKLLKEKDSFSDILYYLELPRSGGNCLKTLKDNIKKWEIDISDFEQRRKIKKGTKISKTKITDINEILVYNSKYNLNGNNLKKKLYKEGLKQPKCEKCGQGEEWQGKILSLHLDHINGDNIDNRLENLRILCPNCHAITDTYCGKNRQVESNFFPKKITPKVQQIKPVSPKKNSLLKNRQNNIELIQNSNIDFSKYGWRLEVAKILNCSPQYAGLFIKKYMLDLYNEKCWKQQ